MSDRIILLKCHNLVFLLQVLPVFPECLITSAAAGLWCDRGGEHCDYSNPLYFSPNRKPFWLHCILVYWGHFKRKHGCSSSSNDRFLHVSGKQITECHITIVFKHLEKFSCLRGWRRADDRPAVYPELTSHRHMESRAATAGNHALFSY